MLIDNYFMFFSKNKSTFSRASSVASFSKAFPVGLANA
jgi:hypothetical protein